MEFMLIEWTVHLPHLSTSASIVSAGILIPPFFSPQRDILSPVPTHPTPTPNRAIKEARDLVDARWDSLQQATRGMVHPAKPSAEAARQTLTTYLLVSATAHCLPHHSHPCSCCLQPPTTATSAQLPCCPPWVCIVGNASSHAHWPWISLLQEPRPPSTGSITSPNPGWEQLPTSEPTSHWPKRCIHPLSSSKEIHSNQDWTVFPPQLYVVALTPASMSRLISHILHQRLVPYL